MNYNTKNKTFINIGLTGMVSFCIVLFLLPASLSAGGFKVLSFKKVDNDISAIMRQYKQLDDNDEVCAIIKVRSDIVDLQFTASTAIVGNIEFRNGEYWIYLSPGTRQLSVFRKGFIKTTYTFPIHISGSSVYSMTVTGETKEYEKGKGSLFITSNPLQAEVRIDGFPDLIKKTPCKFENYRKGVYQFIISRNRYETLDTIVSIEKGITKQISVNLTPQWGNLKVTLTDYIPATFTLKGKTYYNDTLILTGETNGPATGEWLLKISRENYYDTSFWVTIRPGETSLYYLALKPINELLSVKTIPANSKIYIDNLYVGHTPFSKSIIIGQHTIRLKHDNYLDEIKQINLVKNQPLFLTVPLRNQTEIKVESTPPGAVIFVNGKEKGKTPETIKVYTGSNNLMLKKDNYKTLEDQINIVEGKTYSYTLEKEKYQLKILSNPSGATVKINNEEKGITPLEITREYGSYKVTLEKKKYGSKRKQVNLRSDQTVRVNLPRFIAGYLGIDLVFPSSDYELQQLAGEFGWSYRFAPHFINGLGYAFGERDIMEGESFSNIRRINTQDYKNLHTTYLAKDGLAEENSSMIFIKLGLVTFKSVLVLSASVAGYKYSGYYVYIADKDYNSDNGFYNLNKEDLFFDKNSSAISNFSIKYGFGLLLNFGNLYVSGDYWLKNKENINNSYHYSVGVGATF